jgi:tubulin polyglutamylase TTLL6/13
MYVKYTKYSCVKDAAYNFAEFHLTRKEKSDWDICWTDGPLNIQFLKEMKMWQRHNHFPGIYNLARKNMLGRHLMRMQKLLPHEYNFFPTSYMLPHDYKDFFEDWSGQKNPRTYIVKPEDGCQGKGIFLTRNPSVLGPSDQYVV